MKILFVWTGVTSYMADCWRRLQREPDVELKIIVELVEIGKEFDRERVLNSLDTCVVGDRSFVRQINGQADQWRPAELISRFLGAWKPEVMFAVGWHSKVVRELVKRKDWRDVPKVCCFDLPWRWSLRCIAARFVLGPFLRNYGAAYVPGVACERYARWLGFKKVWQGLFSIETEKFRIAGAKETNMRTGFLFVGRKVPEKGIDVLKAAYEMYRQRGGTWTLDIPDWIDPEDVPQVMRAHACLVLPSRWEPWGVVVAEAKAAGMMVIVSDKVNARLDIPCEGVFPSDNAEALAAQMLRVETTLKLGAEEGCRVVDEFDCAAWSGRVKQIVKRLDDSFRTRL